MGQRRILVIGSQCGVLGRLDFLPQAAQELYTVMTDPERGACVPALEGRGVLIDPSVKETKYTIRAAYRRAASDEATLFIAYVGHGEKVREKFYLMPQDSESPPDSDNAVHLANLIAEVHDTTQGHVDGLGVLVDACFSGLAGFGAAQSWVQGLEGSLRFEVLTAAADRPAANGCFTRTLAELLRDGVSAVPSEHLHCLHLRPLLEKACPTQMPQHPAYNPDETLWLAKNGRILDPWAQTPLANQIQQLTLAYQVTPALEEVVAWSGTQQCVAVVGDAGTEVGAGGGTRLAPGCERDRSFRVRACRRAAHRGDDAPGARAHLHRATRPIGAWVPPGAAGVCTGNALRQLAKTRHTGETTGRAASADCASRRGARLVVDALDRLATGTRGSVIDALNELGELAFVRVVITARPDTALPKKASIYLLGRAPEEKVSQYLEWRGLRHAAKKVSRAAEGNWLVVRVLADLLCEQPDAGIGAGQLALGDAYEEMLALRRR